MRIGTLVMACACVLLAASCRPARSGLQIAGSTSVQPLADVLAEGYAQAGGGRVRVQGGGSTAGIQAVLSGAAGVGAISRRVTAEEAARGVVEHIIGYDSICIVVHPTNRLNGISQEQLRDLFRGAITDWRQLGGTPGAVRLVSREAGSGSRDAFRALVGPISPRALIQNSSGAIRAAVIADPQAVGYVSLAALQMGGLKPLAIDGRAPGRSGYPLVRPVSFVTLGPPSGEAAAFLRFARSPAGRQIIREEGLVPVSDEHPLP